MGLIYHFHADVGALGAMDCGLLNGHDASCSAGILTTANEDSCSKVAARFPAGKPHKCYHKVPDDVIPALTAGQGAHDIWVEGRQPKPKPAPKRLAAPRLKPPTKRG
jgi:hypothetical protein